MTLKDDPLIDRQGEGLRRGGLVGPPDGVPPEVARIDPAQVTIAGFDENIDRYDGFGQQVFSESRDGAQVQTVDVADDGHSYTLDSDGRLRRIDESGAVVWTQHPSGASSGRCMALAPGAEYIFANVSWDGDHLIRVDTDDGSSVGIVDELATSIASDDDHLYIVVRLNAEIVKRTQDGTEVWTHELVDNPSRLLSVAVDPGGRVYASYDSPSAVICLDPSGDEIWKTSMPEEVVGAPSGLDVGLDTVAVTLDDRVTALDGDGNIRWSYPGGGSTDFDPESVAVDAHGYVHVYTDNARTITKITPEGSPAWVQKTDWGGSNNGRGCAVEPGRLSAYPEEWDERASAPLYRQTDTITAAYEKILAEDPEYPSLFMMEEFDGQHLFYQDTEAAIEASVGEVVGSVVHPITGDILWVQSEESRRPIWAGQPWGLHFDGVDDVLDAYQGASYVPETDDFFIVFDYRHIAEIEGFEMIMAQWDADREEAGQWRFHESPHTFRHWHDQGTDELEFPSDDDRLVSTLFEKIGDTFKIRNTSISGEQMQGEYDFDQTPKYDQWATTVGARGGVSGGYDRHYPGNIRAVVIGTDMDTAETIEEAILSVK